ncbi:MAG: RES family NAD+ phosphorylase, partial [Verrucomicrobiota bacterium]
SSPVLKVPSIMIPEESNYLLNPEHPRAEEVETGDARTFTFDPRFLDPAATTSHKKSVRNL